MTLSFLATRRGKVTLVLLLPGVAIFSAIATSYTNQLLAGHHAPNGADRRLPPGAAQGDHLPARRRADRPAHQQRPQPNPELQPEPEPQRVQLTPETVPATLR